MQRATRKRHIETLGYHCFPWLGKEGYRRNPAPSLGVKLCAAAQEAALSAPMYFWCQL